MCGPFSGPDFKEFFIMNAPKILSSAVAAAVVAGTVGFAYAQSKTDPATPQTPQSMAPANRSATSPAAADTTTPSSTVTVPSSSSSPSDSTMTPPMEPQAKADRN